MKDTTLLWKTSWQKSLTRMFGPSIYYIYTGAGVSHTQLAMSLVSLGYIYLPQQRSFPSSSPGTAMAAEQTQVFRVTSHHVIPGHHLLIPQAPFPAYDPCRALRGAPCPVEGLPWALRGHLRHWLYLRTYDFSLNTLTTVRKYQKAQIKGPSAKYVTSILPNSQGHEKQGKTKKPS